MPTSRNARGVDIIIYSQDAKRKFTVQAKSLSGKSPVPLGNNLSNLMGDYLIICRNVFNEPEIFIMTIDEIRDKIHMGTKDGRISYWFQPKDYQQFRDRWNLIGKGL